MSSRVVLVTGASRGIGRAIAEGFARRGDRVVVHYAHRAEAAEETIRSLPGGPHHVVAANLADPDAAPDLMTRVVESAGRLDVLVNNAGIFELHPPAEADLATWESAWERTLQVNLTAPAHLMYLASRHLKENGGGRIVNVSSRGAFRGEPDAPAYGASKAGLNAVSQSMAKAMGGSGVLVFVVAPGWVDTDMAGSHLEGAGGDGIRNETAIGRVATADEVADVVVFLGTDAPASMTGCVVDVNGASYLRT